MYAHGVSPIASSESMIVRSASNLSKIRTYLAAGKLSLLQAIFNHLLSSCRNPSRRTASPETPPGLQVTDAEDFSRLLRVNGTAKRKEHRAKGKESDFSIHSILLRSPLFSFDHLVRSCQHIRRNRQADLLRCFQIDDELEFLRLLHG